MDENTPLLGANGKGSSKIPLFQRCLRKIPFQGKKSQYDIPIEEFDTVPLQRAKPKIWPERRTLFISRLYFLYIWRLVITGFRKALSPADLWRLDEPEKAETAFHKLKNLYQGVKQKHPNSKRNLARACFLLEWKPIMLSVLVTCIEQILAFLVVLCVKWLIELPTETDAKPWQGPIYVATMLVAMAIKGLCLQHKDHMMNMVALRFRSALSTYVFTKSLRLSPSSRRQFSSGHITNLAVVDAAQCLEGFKLIQYIWAAPLMLFLTCFILYSVVGHAFWAGIAVALVTFGIVNGVCAKFYCRFYTRQLKQKDERLRLLAEVLKIVKVIKLFAWENAFQNLLERMRNQEMATIRKLYCFYAINDMTGFCTTLLVCLAVFATYTLGFNNPLTPQVAFIVIAVFTFPLERMMGVPRVLMGAAAISASFQRLEEFLCAEELTPITCDIPGKSKAPISIQNADLAWDHSAKPTLQNITLEIPANKLTAIIGQVGSGKSSLLSAITGDMYLQSGKIYRSGEMAYVPQQAWILNQTVRENILFNKPYDESLYWQIISACCLEPDFEILPAGDMSEIGERGINVSGGQKQRISLARAVYQDCDVYLLDDPLSAVDVHVQDHLFKQVIGPAGMLKNKTRILVTHARAFLPQCDNIIVMDKGGIVDAGTFDEISRKKSGMIQPGDELRNKHDEVMERLEQTRILYDGKLVQVEGMSTGAVSARAYWAYFSAGNGLALIVFAGVTLAISCNTAASIFLQLWMKNNNSTLLVSNGTRFSDISLDVSDTQRPMVIALAIIVALQVAFGLIYVISFVFFTTSTSKNLHYRLLKNILGSPLAFFHSTPIGRVLNRFAQDINTVDILLPHLALSALKRGAPIVFGVAAAIYATPIVAALVAPGIIIVIILQKLYIRSARQVQRLEAVSRSPVLSRMHDVLQSPESIRIYNRENLFTNTFHQVLDKNTANLLCQLTFARWLSVNLDFIASIIVASTALVTLLKPDLSPALVGVSLSSIVTLTTFIIHVVAFVCETETAMVSVERIREYVELKSEEALHRELMKLRKKSYRRHSRLSVLSEQIRRFSLGRKASVVKAPQFIGQVEFMNYSLKYRPDLPPVLQDISFQVKAGEKLGIVGRTGSGKSSLVSGLFRLVDPSRGRILIDSMDISEMTLHDLRRQLTIIPQDTALFSGSVRQNLDPCGEYADNQIWHALEISRLKSYVESLDNGLDHNLDCEGSNLSVGQRQLICLARAILRKSKILVLDEATAFVDLETDKWIQAAIRKYFADSTILTIAHRIETIIDYDSVVVLSDGRMVEHGSVKELLKREDSEFRKMVVKANFHHFHVPVLTKV